VPLSGNEKEIKQRIGYSTGTVSWYPRKKISEIVEVTRSFYPDWDEAAYRKYMELFGIDDNKKPIELSEGMKVKFNLLLALSHRAEVLILDEPTSGLDPFSRDELLELFMTLKEHGITIFFSTHITSDLERCADNIVYISGGEIIAACSKADFMHDQGRQGETLEEIFLRLEREVRS
jgi:ABC-2 type transport system ATP-binding protein